MSDELPKGTVARLHALYRPYLLRYLPVLLLFLLLIVVSNFLKIFMSVSAKEVVRHSGDTVLLPAILWVAAFVGSFASYQLGFYRLYDMYAPRVFNRIANDTAIDLAFANIGRTGVSSDRGLLLCNRTKDATFDIFEFFYKRILETAVVVLASTAFLVAVVPKWLS